MTFSEGTNIEQCVREIAQSEWGPGSTSEAMSAAARNAGSKPARRVMILITDGIDPQNKDLTGLRQQRSDFNFDMGMLHCQLDFNVSNEEFKLALEVRLGYKPKQPPPCRREPLTRASQTRASPHVHAF